MAVKMMGAEVKRKEDPRLITGASCTGDHPAGPHHGRSSGVRTLMRGSVGSTASAVLKRPGVVAVVDGADLKPHCGPVPSTRCRTEGGEGESRSAGSITPSPSTARATSARRWPRSSRQPRPGSTCAADVASTGSRSPRPSDRSRRGRPGLPRSTPTRRATWSTRTASPQATRTPPSPKPSRSSASAWSASASAACRWRGARRSRRPTRPPAASWCGLRPRRPTGSGTGSPRSSVSTRTRSV